MGGGLYATLSGLFYHSPGLERLAWLPIGRGAGWKNEIFWPWPIFCIFTPALSPRVAAATTRGNESSAKKPQKSCTISPIWADPKRVHHHPKRVRSLFRSRAHVIPYPISRRFASRLGRSGSFREYLPMPREKTLRTYSRPLYGDLIKTSRNWSE